MTLSETLKKLGAACEGLTWTRGKSLARAYCECENPYWMFWLARRIGLIERIRHMTPIVLKPDGVLCDAIRAAIPLEMVREKLAKVQP